MKFNIRKDAGFTLMEVMVAVAVSGTLAVAGAPLVQNFSQESQVSTVQEAFSESLAQARELAVSTGKSIGVCPTHSGYTCAEKSDWRYGWMVYDMSAEAEPGKMIPDDLILSHYLVEGDGVFMDVFDEGFQTLGQISFDSNGYNNSEQRVASSICSGENAKAEMTMIDRNGSIRNLGQGFSEDLKDEYVNKLEENTLVSHVACLN